MPSLTARSSASAPATCRVRGSSSEGGHVPLRGSGCPSLLLLVALLVLLAFGGPAGVPCVVGVAALNVSPSELAGLTELYHALGGPQWRSNLNWLDNEEPCAFGAEWQGVVCSPDFLGLSSHDFFVVGLRLAGNSLSGSMPNASLWQQLPNLSEVDLSSNEITGSMHGVLGIGMSLSKLDLSHNPLSGVLPTSEWLQVPYLTELTITNTEIGGSLPVEMSLLSQLSSLTLSANRLNGTLPPEWALLSSLRDLMLDTNDLSGLLPPDWGMMMMLSVFSCRDNPRLGGPIPDEWSSLHFFILDLSRCSFTGTIPLWFQNLFIIGIYLDGNQFEGPAFPALCNPIVGFLYIDNNRLNGTLDPCLGTLSGLAELTAANNQLEGELPFNFGGATSVGVLDFSNNRLSSSTGALPSSMSSMANLRSLSLRNNPDLRLNLDGTQGVKGSGGIEPLSTLENLSRLDLSNTSLSGDMSMFGLNAPSGATTLWKALTDLTLANNQLRGKPSGNVLNKLTNLKTFDISQNPYLTGDLSDLTDLNSLLALETPLLRWDGHMPPGIVPDVVAGLVLADATMPGVQCPQFRHESRSMIFRVDPTYHEVKLCTCQKGWYGTPPTCHQVPTNLASNSISAALQSLKLGGGVRSDMVRAFSDSDFGDQRQLTGIELAYTIDAEADADPAAPPVLAIYISLSLNRSVFVGFDNLLSIYGGDASLSGTRFAYIRGLDSSLTSTVVCPETIANDAQLTAPGQLQQQVAVVFGPQAVIQFSSRGAGGHHFDAAFAFSSECPTGYWPTGTAEYCELIPETFHLNSELQITVYVVNAFVLLLLVALVCIVVVYRETPVIRASSSVFNLVILLGLVLMSVSGITWALEANTAVCHARGWLTPFSMVIALGALVVKSDRIRRIFTVQKLQKVVLTNSMLMRTLGLIALPQLAMSIAYSAVPLVTAQLVRGSGSVSNRLVHACHTASGFQTWYAVELALMSLLLLVSLYNAVATRNAPSAFSESQWIGASVYLFALFMLLGLPLQVLVSDNPDTLAVLNGLGLGVAALSLAGLLFATKCWAIFHKRGAGTRDLTQMTGGGSKTQDSSMQMTTTATKATRTTAAGNQAAKRTGPGAALPAVASKAGSSTNTSTSRLSTTVVAPAPAATTAASRYRVAPSPTAPDRALASASPAAAGASHLDGTVIKVGERETQIQPPPQEPAQLEQEQQEQEQQPLPQLPLSPSARSSGGGSAPPSSDQIVEPPNFVPSSSS